MDRRPEAGSAPDRAGMTARFFQRPYPSANTILLTGPRPVLVDTGAVSDIPALLAWLDAQRTPAANLALTVNTHWHVDHSGGNLALQRIGIPLAAAAPDAAALAAHHPDFARAHWLHQPAAPYQADRALHPGDTLDTGTRRWTVLALPGHTATQIGLWDPCGRIIVGGDALHDADIGWLDTEADPQALDHAAATLDHIEALAPGIVLSGHGPAIHDVPTALHRARRRLHGFRTQPDRMAWHACKRIFTHALIMTGGLPRDAVASYLDACPWFHDHARRAFGVAPDTFRPMLLDEMVRSGAAGWADECLVPTGPFVRKT